MKYHIEFKGDYKTQLSDIISAREDDLKRKPMQERHDFIAWITDLYIEQTGERPDHRLLNRLSNVYLFDYLEGDTHPDKITRNEYPILSSTQLLARRTGRTRNRTVTGVVNSETQLSGFVTDNYAVDGVNYSLPLRRY